MKRRPKWHKPRAGLAASLGFGTYVIAGAAVWGEPQMAIFGTICGSLGLLIYGTDCGLRKLINGIARPPEVFETDMRWMVALVAIGGVLGLASPLYLS